MAMILRPRRGEPVHSIRRKAAFVHGFCGEVAPAANLAVLTPEALPIPSDGKTYQAWVLQGDQWTSLGTFMPDADGTARVIAENSVLASSPNAVEVTVESAAGSQTPSDTVVLRWLPA